MTEIRQLGDAILRKVATAVEEVQSPESLEIVAQMQAILENSNGVGLAAPQIGYSVRVIIVASKPTLRYPNAPFMKPLVMFNPYFHALSEEKVKDWEGCLSISGIRALVPRYKYIKVHYTNRSGMPCTVEWHDFIARVFQHEYDHLQGKVYLDSVEDSRDIISETEFFKLMAAH